MAAQDDAREREMRTLFNLTRPERYGRSDIDAVLELEGPAIPPSLHGMEVPFELKSATTGEPDISTVRDFGRHHIEKWRPLHWIFGVYDRNARGDQVLQYCLYGSPQAMSAWYEQMLDYSRADFELADEVPELVGPETLRNIYGSVESFDRAAAKKLMKNQLRAADYVARSDLPDGRYSRDAMLAMLRDRARYLILRGATRNNPHIPPTYFRNWERIERNHAARLRELVVEALMAST